ncbi:MAG: xanthine dehydrogenase family protein subunit M [Deltaproteobacteria bacterium]|nr:xanthine dehydrogenase family protein subunit M [Deltaproteobacteria bacterium]
MILHDFKYRKPTCVDEALAVLAEHKERARPLAGGTDVVVNMKQRSVLQLVDGAGTKGAKFATATRVPPIDRPEVVVSLGALDELVGIAVQEDQVLVGPGTTMAQVVQQSDLPSGAEALRDAAAVVGSPHIRNRATVGGNIVNARPAADTAVAVIALGAQLELASTRGRRTVAADGFITAPGKTVKRPDELVVSIDIPTGAGQGSAYLRQGTRNQLEIALVGVASWIALDPDSGVIDDARICLGAVGPTPLLATRAAQSLLRKQPTGEVFSQAADIARSEAKPIDDFRGSAEYRRDIVEVMTRRTLEIAADRAVGRGGGR